MAADSSTSLGRRTDARGGVQRPGRDFFMGHRARGRGRGQGAGGGGARAREGAGTVERPTVRVRNPSAKRAEQIGLRPERELQSCTRELEQQGKRQLGTARVATSAGSLRPDVCRPGRVRKPTEDSGGLGIYSFV
jgi:hypothetical protein